MFTWIRRRTRRLSSRSSNEAWLEALRGPEQPQAIQALRALLVEGLRVVLARRVPGEAEALAEDFAQEALVKILDHLDTFRSESRLTTWAQKIAVHVAFTELRRKRWEDVSLQDLAAREDAPAALSDPAPSPEETADFRLLAEKVQVLIQEVLTERQRTALTAVLIHGMPLEEVARRMDTNRNALYKLLHDARRRMRRALEHQGIDLDAFLAGP